VQAARRQVHNVGDVLLVFSAKEEPKAGEPVTVQKVLLTNAVALTAARVVELYDLRWQVEKAQADYPSRRRGVCTRRIGYHRHSGVARTGRVVPATPGRSPRRSRMSDTTPRPTPPRA
jgi:hypothetical protein